MHENISGLSGSHEKLEDLATMLATMTWPLPFRLGVSSQFGHSSHLAYSPRLLYQAGFRGHLRTWSLFLMRWWEGLKSPDAWKSLLLAALGVAGHSSHLQPSWNIVLGRSKLLCLGMPRSSPLSKARPARHSKLDTSILEGVIIYADLDWYIFQTWAGLYDTQFWFIGLVACIAFLWNKDPLYNQTSAMVSTWPWAQQVMPHTTPSRSCWYGKAVEWPLKDTQPRGYSSACSIEF